MARALLSDLGQITELWNCGEDSWHLLCPSEGHPITMRGGGKDAGKKNLLV